MSNGYVVPFDPTQLSRFAGDDPREEGEFFDEADEDETEIEAQVLQEFLQQQEYRLRLDGFLDRIPEREADIIHLYFILEKRQADIAKIFAMTQAAVSYRLARGIKRIRFLLDIPDVTVEAMRSDLSEIFPPSPPLRLVDENSDLDDNLHLDVRILVSMWQTTCQSEVATRLKLTQGCVRHRFFKAVIRLEEAATKNAKYAPYAEIFTKISARGFNILREVKLPQWEGRGGDECS